MCTFFFFCMQAFDDWVVTCQGSTQSTLKNEKNVFRPLHISWTLLKRVRGLDPPGCATKPYAAFSFFFLCVCTCCY